MSQSSLQEEDAAIEDAPSDSAQESDGVEFIDAYPQSASPVLGVRVSSQMPPVGYAASQRTPAGNAASQMAPVLPSLGLDPPIASAVGTELTLDQLCALVDRPVAPSTSRAADRLSGGARARAAGRMSRSEGGPDTVARVAGDAAAAAHPVAADGEDEVASDRESRQRPPAVASGAVAVPGLANSTSQRTTEEPMEVAVVTLDREAVSADEEVAPGAANRAAHSDSGAVAVEDWRRAGSGVARRSIGASGVWRDTDFRESTRGGGVSGSSVTEPPGAAVEPADALDARSVPAAASVAGAEAITGTHAGHDTPAKVAQGACRRRSRLRVGSERHVATDPFAGRLPAAEVRSRGSEDRLLPGPADSPGRPSEPTDGTRTSSGCPPAAEVRSPGSEDGQCCTICFEPWSNSGEHRIASLKCGHLFGRSCIERWLRGRDLRCPQCNDKANRRDIRVIFAKSLKVLDTTDRDRALEDLDRERDARRKLELDFAVVQVKCQMKENKIEQLQAELRLLRQQTGGACAPDAERPSAAAAAGRVSLSLQTSVEVSRAGGCRVMEHNGWLGMLVVSQPSLSTLFPGHGVRKINTLDMRAMQFVSLHSKQVRDVRFSPDQRDLLLSVSLDGRAKLTNVCANTLVQTYACDAACWSCAWDGDAPHAFYVGLQSGAVLAFDTRAGTEPLATLAPPYAAGAPVVALRHVRRVGADGVSGLLACRLGVCSLHEVAGQRRRHDLPLAGPFVSAAFDERTRHLLVSSRPSSRQPHAQHTVCRLRRLAAADTAGRPPPVSADVVQVFRGGTSQRVLSRSALLPHPLRQDAPLVCASQETARVTQLWDLASGECVHTLAASEPVLDACPLDVRDRQHLALLTEHAVKLYRWQLTT